MRSCCSIQMGIAVSEEERDRQDEIETGTEKVFHSQMKPNEERQLLYRLATQTQ